MTEKIFNWVVDKLPNLIGFLLLSLVLWSLLLAEQTERIRLTNKLIEPEQCVISTETPTKRTFPD